MACRTGVVSGIDDAPQEYCLTRTLFPISRLIMTMFNITLLEPRGATARGEVPCPWYSLDGFLTDHAFATLNTEFPPLDLFEHHEGLYRKHGQRPHNRYYLAFEKSIYNQANDAGDKGCARLADLSAGWQAFINELTTGELYTKFVANAFNVDQFDIRLAWHMAGRGDDVSPHRDATAKLGTHIFYFNTTQDWREEWGGGTVLLEGRNVERMNPEYDDFDRTHTVPILNNKSLLFKNTPDAWHGVEPLQCPQGKYRRIFTVVFTYPKAKQAPAPKSRVNSLFVRFSSILRRTKQ